jgi:hypothetical protein
LGRSICPFLFPHHSTDRSNQTEIRNRRMSDRDAFENSFFWRMILLRERSLGILNERN